MIVPETILHCKGSLSFESIASLLNELKSKKQQYEIKVVVYKKLLSLIIESLENMLKYEDYYKDFVQENPEFMPEFRLEKDGKNFMISTMNPILNKHIKELKGKIDKVNGLDLEGLKTYYRSTITNGRFTPKGGAGLGFIEMAKITMSNLEYDFKKINRKYSVFKLLINLNSTKS